MSKRDELRRIVRFGAVGVINTGVHYGCYLLLRLVIPYLIANVLGMLIAMIGSYFLNCRFTFGVRPSLRGLLLYPLSNLTNIALTTAGMYVLVEFLGVPEWIAPLPVAAIAVPVTFLVARYLLTGPPSKRAELAARGTEQPL